tara:strand:- start:3686 stop:6259 length:2574 start_codon:yes stop_codon:yes gene_type:complete
MKKSIKKIKKHHIGHIFLSIVIVGIVFGASVILWVSSLPLPDFSSFEQRKISESTKIYDRTGEVILFDVHRDIKRTVVPLEEIGRHIKNATIAIEDSEFYDHKGVKPTAIIRAFFTNLTSGSLRGQGGSTITQQVIKNSLLSSEKKYTRKIKEAILALKLEKAMEKDGILEIYLNESPYGGNLYGVEEASLAFFGKKASDISLAQSAYLAALPQAPTYFSPYGENTDDLEERKNIVLTRMVELGFITAEEAEEAKEEEVLFSSASEQQIKAPHFVLFIREYLENKYGNDVIETQGLSVITSIDWTLQQKAEEMVKRYAEKNTRDFNAYNAALVAIDPNTGQILSMVGSRDWFSEEPLPEGCTPGLDCKFDPKVNVATRYPGRQPGSSFKPFVYATAFKNGFTPETVVFDVQTQFSSECDAFGNPITGGDSSVCYSPQNYDLKLRGPVTLRNALAQSMNIPAVKTLYLAGLVDSLKTARDFGISTLTDANQYGLTLVLGGGEVTLLELTNAYGVFAQEGIHNPYAGIIRVEDSDGNILEEFEPQPIRALDEQIARQISGILSDNEARAPAFGSNSPMHIPGIDTASKTGTTNDFRDSWIIGYTPNIVVGAWAGNSDNSSMKKEVAGFVIAPLWREFLSESLKTIPPKQFTSPTPTPEGLKPVLRGVWEGSKNYFIDIVSGKLATEFTPEETKEEKTLMQVHSILHWVDKKNPQGNIPNDPTKDSQYDLWETKVDLWATSKNLIDDDEGIIPVEVDDIHVPENKPIVTAINPTQTKTYSRNEIIPVEFSTQSVYPIEQADFFINGVYLKTSQNAPFSTSFSASNIQTQQETNILSIRVYDSVRNQTEIHIPFKVVAQTI